MKLLRTAVAACCVMCVLATALVSLAAPTGKQQPTADRVLRATSPMTASSEARRLKSASRVNIEWTPAKGLWRVNAEVTRGHANGLYALWLTNIKPTIKLIGPRRADGSGSVRFDKKGVIDPMKFKSIEVYYLPNANAKPGKGAVLMFSIPATNVDPRGAAANMFSSDMR